MIYLPAMRTTIGKYITLIFNQIHAMDKCKSESEKTFKSKWNWNWEMEKIQFFFLLKKFGFFSSIPPTIQT